MDILCEIRSFVREMMFYRKVLVRVCSFSEKFSGVGFFLLVGGLIR